MRILKIAAVAALFLATASIDAANTSREIYSATGGVAATPSNTTIYSTPSRAVYVGTGGDLAVRMAGEQNNLTLPNVPDGTLLPIAVDMVLSTGTTASDIVLLY